MWLVVNNDTTRVAKHTEGELAWLDNFLGIPDVKARFRRGGKEGRVAMLNAFTLTFPTGMLPIVLSEGAKAGQVIEILRDERVKPCGPDPQADSSWLMDFQDAAIEHAVEKRRGVFHVPTGGGKTELGAALSVIFPCEWAVFVASKSLVKEWVDRIEMRTGETPGVIGDGAFKPRRVTVAMFQTVHRALANADSKVKKWLDGVQAFIVDECHLVAADTLWSVAMACKNAYYRFGNSATPFARGDRRGALVVAAIGPVIYRITQSTLVTQGTIAKGKVHLVRYALDSVRAEELRDTGASYNDAYESLIAGNFDRDAAIIRVVKVAPKPAFVFVRLLDHGRSLTDALNANGVASEFVWGEKHVKVREAAVRRLEHGDVDVIVCNVVFQAGVNVPTLASVVNAAGGKSHIAALQQTGRGSRRMDRHGAVVKDTFDVYDISDVNCGCKVADPLKKGKSKWRHRACKWLETHAKSRRRAYLSEGYEVVESDLA